MPATKHADAQEKAWSAAVPSVKRTGRPGAGNTDGGPGPRVEVTTTMVWLRLPGQAMPVTGGFSDSGTCEVLG